MLFRGGAAVQKMYRGGSEVIRAYRGNVEVWARPLVPVSVTSTSGMDTETSVWATMHEETVRGHGPATISATWEWQSVAFYAGAYMTYVDVAVNGTAIEQWSRSRQAAGWVGSGSVNYPLREGDVVALRGMCENINNAHLRHILGWSLAIAPA